MPSFNSITNPRLFDSKRQSVVAAWCDERRVASYGSDISLRDVIQYLLDAARMFEEIDPEGRVDACCVARANLLYIAKDHLTDHPSTPLNDAEKNCIGQVLSIFHDMCQDRENAGLRQSLSRNIMQLDKVMSYFNIWDWNNLDSAPADNKPTDQQQPRRESGDTYNEEAEIEEQIKNLQSGELSLHITKVPYNPKCDYNKELRELIGLQTLKEQLQKQLAVFRVQQERQRRHPGIDATAAINYLFLGNPGTGKTTVARLLSGILHEEGLLRKGHYIEVKASDLVSPYIGQSAKNTQLAALMAIDGMLFIDEAYALAGEGNRANSTNEVIDTLTPLLETYRGRICVVLAGYEKEMMNLFAQTNTGFASRFPNAITFENYNANEMLQIFHIMLKKQCYNMANGVDERVAQVFECFEQASEHISTFANARTVRTYFEKMRQRSSIRIEQQHLIGNSREMDTFVLDDTELTDAEIWTVLGVVKPTTQVTRQGDYISHLCELLGCAPRQSMQDSAPKSAPAEGRDNRPATSNDDVTYGIIMTDIKKLAVKGFDSLLVPVAKDKYLNTSEYVLGEVINPYISAMRAQGINYTLLDVSDDAYSDILTDDPSWRGYLTILNQFAAKHPECEGGTLFIIGGQDIIPSPIVTNPVYPLFEEQEKRQSIREKELEADVLYGYSLEDIHVDKNRNLDYDIFECEPHFVVGRLPMEDGAMSHDRWKVALVDYLSRAIRQFSASDSKPRGLTARNHVVTSCEALRYVSRKMLDGVHNFMPLPQQPGLVDGDGMFLSPQLQLQDTDDMNTLMQQSVGADIYHRALQKADMLTFSLHGSPALVSKGFYGQSKQGKHDVAFLPILYKDCPATVISAICCWGARYVGYKQEDSSLLTALSNQALLYAGSCRTAYGRFDPQHAVRHYSEVYISNANVLIGLYESYLMKGVGAGYAMYLAKEDCLSEALRLAEEQDKKVEDSGVGTIIYALLTILEFNLFGDPALSLIPQDSNARGAKMSVSSLPGTQAKYMRSALQQTTYEPIDVEDNNSMSLLERMRRNTNSNLEFIRERINKRVYEQLGLPPQALSSMVAVRKNGKDTGYHLRYTQSGEYFDQYTAVLTDTDGNVQQVMNSL